MIRPAPPEFQPQGPWLYFTETKGEGIAPKDRALPVLPQLQRVIDATPSGHMTFIVTEFGKPFSANGFGNKFREWCDQAGLPHCSAHGLRKAGATIAAENGATEHQLMAIYGWSSPKQAAHYTKKARRAKLAGAALNLVLPEQSDNECFPLLIEGAGEWETSAKKTK
jgi:integrase